jgi:hypothetical protein
MTLTRLKIDCIRYDGAAEFAKIATFRAFCVNNRITMEETAAYTHTFDAGAEGAVRIVKEHHQEKVQSFNMHVTDANMHVTVPTCDFAKITCQHLWQSLA